MSTCGCELDRLVATHDSPWHWVNGHAGHTENERADELANRGIDSLQLRR